MSTGNVTQSTPPPTSLAALNHILAPVEWALSKRLNEPERPVIFIVGCPRTGTTLLSQLLAMTTAFGYVSNFMARFWLAPQVGARLARPFGLDRLTTSNLASTGGRTNGHAEPHEFGYFWDRWFAYRGSSQVAEHDLAAIDRNAFRRSIASLEAGVGRPVFFKNQNKTSFQIRFLAETLPTAKFIFVRRDPRFQVQSVLRMREKLNGDPARWWSTRPPEVDSLLNLSPTEQVVAQTRLITAFIEAALGDLPDSRWLELWYENLCDHTATEIERCLALAGIDAQPAESPKCLPTTNRPIPDPKKWAEIERQCRNYGLI